MVTLGIVVYCQTREGLVSEAKLIIELANDNEIGLEVGVTLDAFPRVLQLHKRLGGLASGKQAAAVFKGFLRGRGAPGEGGHQTNGGQ
jgi:hypothetical protein